MATKKSKSRGKNLSGSPNTSFIIGVIALAVFALFAAIFVLSNREKPTYEPLEEKKQSSKAIMGTTESTRPVPVLEGYGFDVGSMWIYETLDATLTIKVTDKYTEAGKTIYVYSFYYGDKKIAEEHRLQTKDYIAKLKSVQGESTVTVFSPPLVLYKFPLKAGMKWTNRFKIEDVSYVSEVTVVGYEKITTKGGVYMAYKIQHRTYPENDPKSVSVDADWFNPRIGLIAYAKEGGENPKALIKYSVKLIDFK
jgi:hypothetical protein